MIILLIRLTADKRDNHLSHRFQYLGKIDWGLKNGFHGFIKGNNRAKPGVSPLSKEELIAKMLDLNREDLPFKIEKVDDVDLLAQWIIVEASLYKIFAKTNREKVLKIKLSLDESKLTVRMLEESYSVSYRAGVPDSLSFGNVHQYRFNVSGMKRTIIKIITGSGWDFVSVISKKNQ